MSFEDYFDIWFPVFVAIFSIFLAWFCVRLLEEDDKDEDEGLTEKIKTVLNPDKVSTVPFVSENMKEEEDVDCSNTELKKAILTPEDESTEEEMTEEEMTEEEMTEEEMESEKRTQQEQLQSIFKLMETDKEKYGVTSFADVKEEMERYKTG